MKQLTDFIKILSESVNNQTFIKLTLSKPSVLSDLKNIYIRLIEVKNQAKLSFTYHYKTRDEVKNYAPTEGVSLIKNLIQTDFLNADLFVLNQIISLKINKKRDNSVLKIEKSKENVVPTEGGNKEHDIEKKRLLDPHQLYFNALEITDKNGNITPNGQKKFKQINKYVEIIDSLLKQNLLPEGAVIADFGSGKGYLTFALYDHLTNNLHLKPVISGFELREELVHFCNNLSVKSGFDNLHFIAKDINDLQINRLDMLIALHACDTATDVAIAKGIKSNAQIIIVAPCCHKQIRKQLSVKNEMQPVLKHGILEERQAELLTDGIRALLMEASGYKTKVFEFVSTEHTPKNVMIVGTKARKNEEALAQVEAIKKHYGIAYHHLEKLL
jgi:hypothetical protein